jgi:hypothetical protein
MQALLPAILLLSLLLAILLCSMSKCAHTASSEPASPAGLLSGPPSAFTVSAGAAAAAGGAPRSDRAAALLGSCTLLMASTLGFLEVAHGWCMMLRGVLPGAGASTRS